MKYLSVPWRLTPAIAALLWLGLLLSPVLAQKKNGSPDDTFRPLSHPSSGFFALAKAYAPSKDAFETSWKNFSSTSSLCDMKNLMTSGGSNPFGPFGPFLSEAGPQPKPFAYQTVEGHHRILGFAYDSRHYFIVVRFKEPTQDDLAIFLSFPFEKPGALSKSVAEAFEYLPYSLDSAKQHKDHPLTADGKIDPAVFMRDFFSVLAMVY